MAETALRHLVFACGSSEYAVPDGIAIEVVVLPPLTVVPGAPRHVLGIFAHRGEVMPVVEMARLVGRPLETPASRAVLVRGAAGLVALSATRVRGVEVLEGNWERLGAEGVMACLSGPAVAPSGEVAVIDVAALVGFLARGGA